jgi:kynurenine formamidase
VDADNFPDLRDFRAVGRRLSNWGRWGSDDELGTLNFITPERIIAAAALVRQGKVFDLAIPFNAQGPQPGGGRVGRVNPIHLMSETGADQPFPEPLRVVDDFVIMPLQAASQWDALGHVFYDEQLYNGYSASAVTPHGLKRNSIDKISRGVVGRGVLLDIAALRGRDWLDAGFAITADDLDQAVAREETEVRSGDILLVRTGWRRFFLEHGSREAFMAGEPGLGMSCCRWLFEHEIAAVAADNFAIEVIPGEFEPERSFYLHLILIRDMGMTLGEIMDFEALAADCALDGVYEFFFCGPVLPFTGAAGSPTNPLALK